MVDYERLGGELRDTYDSLTPTDQGSIIFECSPDYAPALSFYLRAKGVTEVGDATSIGDISFVPVSNVPIKSTVDLLLGQTEVLLVGLDNVVRAIEKND